MARGIRWVGLAAAALASMTGAITGAQTSPHELTVSDATLSSFGGSAAFSPDDRRIR